MENNSKKVVLVSGSSKGIGEEISNRFITENYAVIKNSRAKFSGSLPEGVEHVVADVSNFDDCLSMIKYIKKNYGRIDVLICNVGSGESLEPNILAPHRWDKFFKSNLFSATYLVEAALPLLLESKGSVVAISSICGSSQVEGAPIEYTVAKAALDMYIKTMAFKYGRDGVRFNVVAPGNVLFEGSVWEKKLSINSKDTNEYVIQKVPMGTFVTPMEIAEAVLFLASGKSKHTTGVVLNVDGGQSL